MDADDCARGGVRVAVGSVREAANLLFEHLERDLGVHSVALANDYYWYIPAEQRRNPLAEPAEFTLGQVSDDWIEIERIARRESPPVLLGLRWLAALLAEIADEPLHRAWEEGQ